MSKRNRSDRKKAQQQRAVQAGDFSALRALAERNPAAGAKALLQQRESSAEPPSRDWLAVAALTCARLRTDLQFELAGALAHAGAGADASLRAEEALAAFACGNDPRVRELAALDPDIARMAEPWLAAVTGARVPNAPSACSDPWRSILSLCRAVSHVSQGKAARVRPLLAQISPSVRGKLFASDMEAVARVIACKGGGRGGTFEKALARVADNRLLRATRGGRSAIAMTAARKAPKLFLDKLRDTLKLDEESTRDAVMHAAFALTGSQDKRALASQVIARAGADAFPPEERANASLHAGFALAASSPNKARESLDRAVALGAELTEALRGRYLIERTRLARVHGSGSRAEQDAVRALQSAAQSLANAWLRDEASKPLAAVALMESARALANLGQHARALEQVLRVRQLAADAAFPLGTLATELDLAEAEIRVPREPARAQELVDSVLARDPLQHDAWHLKIDLATDRTAAEDLVLRAAELKVCPELVAEAKSIRKKRGLSRALEPGRVTAGELADELLSRAQARKIDGGLGSDIEACRATLDPSRRAAFDAASIGILVIEGNAPLASTIAVNLLRTPDLGQEHRSMILAALLISLDPEGFVAVASRFDTRTSVDAIRLLIAEGERKSAQTLLGKTAHALDAAVLRELQAQLHTAMRGTSVAGVPDCEALLGSADALLAPDFSVVDLVYDEGEDFAGNGQDFFDEDEDEDEDEDDEDDRVDSSGPPVLETLLGQLGLPRSLLDRLSPEKRTKLTLDALDMTMERSMKKSANKLFSILRQLGVDPESVLGRGRLS